MVRTRDDLVQARVAAANQLAALLDAHWPGAKATFADIDSPIALQFLASYPTAAHAERLGEKRIAAFCAKHGYPGRRTPAQLPARLRAAPAGSTDPTLCQAVRDAVLALAGVLKALGAALKDLARSVAATRGAPGRRGLHVAATLGSDQRRPDARRVGRCPASLRRPGRRRRPGRGHPGHQGIRQAPRRALPLGLQHAPPPGGDHLRRQHRHTSPWAAKVYADARARGHDHPHAIRVLARAWIRVIFRCWLDRVPYNPARQGSLQRSEAAQRKELAA